MRSGDGGFVLALMVLVVIFLFVACNRGKEQMEFEVDEITDVVCGIHEEEYVLAGSDLYLPSLLPYDDSIVMEVGADADQIDLDVVGDYEVDFGVRLDARDLCSYLGQDFDNGKQAISDIFFKKTIHVVDSKTAQALADQDASVYTGTGSIFPKSDGSFLDIKVEPVSIGKTGGNVKAEAPYIRRKTFIGWRRRLIMRLIP